MGSELGSLERVISSLGVHSPSEARAAFDALLADAPVTLSLCDRDLRCRWIHGAPPDFDAVGILGKRDDELAPSEGGRRLVALKHRVLTSGRRESARIAFPVSDGLRSWDFVVSPLRDANDTVVALGCVAWETTEDAAQLEDERAQKAALRDAHERTSRFLATLGHELRGPLAAARTAAEMLDELPADERSRVQGVLLRQLDQLEGLIGDLLDASRVRRGKVSLHPTPHDARDDVRHAVETVRLDGGGRIETDLPEALPVVGDVTRLREVFANLLDNAVKHSAGRSVAVHGACVDGRVEVRVRDEGDGMTAEQLASVLEPFQQAPNAKDGGLGIGLAVVDGLVRLHRGTLDVHSDGPGEGTEVVVRLPRHAG